EEGSELNLPGAEPVLFLALVQREFEQTYTQCDRAETDEIHGRTPFHSRLNLWWVFDHTVREKERQQAERQIDEENPVPVVVVGKPATERRADGRSHDHGHAIQSEGLPAFLDGESVGKNRLLTRSQSSAAKALQNTRQNQSRQRGSKAAQQRTGREHHNADHVEAL